MYVSGLYGGYYTREDDGEDRLRVHLELPQGVELGKDLYAENVHLVKKIYLSCLASVHRGCLHGKDPPRLFCQKTNILWCPVSWGEVPFRVDGPFPAESVSFIYYRPF